MRLWGYVVCISSLEINNTSIQYLNLTYFEKHVKIDERRKEVKEWNNELNLELFCQYTDICIFFGFVAHVEYTICCAVDPVIVIDRNESFKVFNIYLKFQKLQKISEVLKVTSYVCNILV